MKSKFRQILQDHVDFGFQSLIESIGPVQTEFGTDLKNEKWSKVSELFGNNKLTKFIKKMKDNPEDLLSTFTNINGTFYQVYLAERGSGFELGFSSSNEFDANDIPGSMEKFSWGVDQGVNAFKVFNRVFYIALKGIEKFKINRIAFRGVEATGLDKIYKKMVEQKSLQNFLKDYGYEYKGQNKEGYFLFERI